MASPSVDRDQNMVRRADQMIAPSRRNAPGVQQSQDSRKAAADGYVRKTPVQEIKVDPAYKNRLIKRALTLTVALAAVVVIIYFMSRYIAFF